MYSIFIFGLLPESSGKTVISSALARGMINRGMKTCVFKPRSGHNFWYQYDAFLKCKNEGRLFCEDIMKLREACKSRLPPEILNPVDALLSPLNVKTFIKRNAINQLYIFEDDIFLHLIAERYTLCNDRIKNILCINMKSLKSCLLMTDREYIRKLESHADEVLYLSNVDEWNSVFQCYGPKAISSCYQKISKSTDYMIIEGFNDAVCPERSLRYDLVIGVAPGITIFYDAENFHAVLETFEGLGKDPKGLRAKDVLRYLKKIEVLSIHALPSSCFKNYDRLSEKLSQVVDLTLQLSYRSEDQKTNEKWIVAP